MHLRRRISSHVTLQTYISEISTYHKLPVLLKKNIARVTTFLTVTNSYKIFCPLLFVLSTTFRLDLVYSRIEWKVKRSIILYEIMRTLIYSSHIKSYKSFMFLSEITLEYDYKFSLSNYKQNANIFI